METMATPALEWLHINDSLVHPLLGTLELTPEQNNFVNSLKYFDTETGWQLQTIIVGRHENDTPWRFVHASPTVRFRASELQAIGEHYLR